MEIAKNKYLKSLFSIYKKWPIEITNVHLETLVIIKYVICIFINRMIYRVVLLNILVFMETAKNNKIKNKLTCLQ